MTIKSLLAALALTLCATLPAHAQLFGGGLDKSFCLTKPVRQTVVYVDDMLMINDKTDWVQRLLGKLKASLAPGERTTVVQLSPGRGSNLEIWSGCWPAFTAEKRAEVAAGGPYLLRGNPLEGLVQQQAYFSRDFVAAVSKIYFAARRPRSSVMFTPENAPKKQILRAIASDEGRFSNSLTTVRAIVYSDMAENSDLGSIFKPLPDRSVNYATKLGTHLRKSVFYVFGVGEDVSAAPPIHDKAKAFWTNALNMMSATVGGFGADLNVPTGFPVNSLVYVVTLKMGGQQLDGKMSLLTDADGNLVDSWLGFQRLNISGVIGTFRCTRSACRLDGTTTANLATTSDIETLVLSGSQERLSGELGVKGTSAMFPLTAVQPTN